MRNNSEISNLISALKDKVKLDDLCHKLNIPVKRTGSQNIAQCQFHDDQNPSMLLYDDVAKGLPHFHCHACSAHGDIFNLVQQVNSVDFMSSVRWLAEQYNFKFPEKRLSSSKSFNKPIDRAHTYQRVLSIYQEKTDAKKLKRWIENKRKINATIIEKAKLVYAKQGTIVGYISEQSITYGEKRKLIGEFADIGIIRNDKNTSFSQSTKDRYLNIEEPYRDFFFDERVLFPIQDRLGNITGFAGRVIDDNSKYAKYLYTPDLEKSKILYRANIAFDEIKSVIGNKDFVTLFLTEGLLDALRLESLGLPAVSVLGAQLSEEQAYQIVQFASSLSKNKSLRVAIFLDRDKAGYRGAAASIKRLHKSDTQNNLDIVFIWPKISEETTNDKDADDFLKACQNPEDAKNLIEDWIQPCAVALLANELEVSPDKVLDNNSWELMSVSRRIRALKTIINSSGVSVDSLILFEKKENTGEKYSWYNFVIRYLESKPSSLIGIDHQQQTESSINRSLNLARDLAESETRRGELPSDIACWRRINVAGLAFNEAIKARLSCETFAPLEPYDAVKVSRGFGKEEHRLKTMPCPEDLIAIQYMMSELLTERFDVLYDSTYQFSNFIPAVRYDRIKNSVWTTGEDGAGVEKETLSFGYQIDMEVLEGRQPPNESGMFRPYFDCWRDFIASLVKKSQGMGRVYMIRLDMRRYYDNLYKSVVRDVLISSLGEGLRYVRDIIAPIFKPHTAIKEKDTAIIDWLLDQSFCYQYYDPETGAVVKKNDTKGIPQGPGLSAWLANIVLFRIDSALRKKLKELNEKSTIAAYSRYVDDLVMIANSEQTLSIMRATAEEVAIKLKLELVSKEATTSMSEYDFEKHLMDGRAFAASGPMGDADLLSITGGDLGWTAWSDTPKRYSALQLLRDRSLYNASEYLMINQIGTALSANGLRPSELGKAARWLWYLAATKKVENIEDNNSCFNFIRQYWIYWKDVIPTLAIVFNVEICGWDDPAFYALEGLDKLLDPDHFANEQLSFEENEHRKKVLKHAAQHVVNDNFFSCFLLSDDLAPKGWGVGCGIFERMFNQRVISVRWKAMKLSGKNPKSKYYDSFNKKNTLNVSLKRAIITDAETCGSNPDLTTQNGVDPEENGLRSAILWLHEAYVRLGFISSAEPNDSDPLEEIAEQLRRIRGRYNPNDFMNILNLLLPDEGIDYTSENNVIKSIALSTLVSISPRQKHIDLLVKRPLLIKKFNNQKILPPIPGINPAGIIVSSETKLHSENSGGYIEINDISIISVELNGDKEGQASTIINKMNIPYVKNNTILFETLEIIPTNNTNINEFVSDTKFKWSKVLPQKRCSMPPRFDFCDEQLKWVADVYESICRINCQRGSEGKDDEYVPAWPYLVSDYWPDSGNPKNKNYGDIALLTFPVKRDDLNGRAFIRDGERGLKTYKVPEEQGYLWRAGVALTDMLGFNDELDRYATIELSENQRDNGHALSNKLLRTVLCKLRGQYHRGKFLPSTEKNPHIPATLLRSLKLLREYPVTASKKERLSFVLFAEMETRTMARRLSVSNWDLSRPGAAIALIAQASRDLINRIPITWIELLCEDKIEFKINLKRDSVNAIGKFVKMIDTFSSHKQMDSIDLSHNSLICGLNILVITAWLRAQAFELSASGLHFRNSISTSIDLSTAWGIVNPELEVNKSYSVDDFLEKFSNRINQGATQKSFELITPLGWLVLVAYKVGLIEEINTVSFNNNDSIRQIRIQKVQKLAISLADFSIFNGKEESKDWPFEYNLNSLKNENIFKFEDHIEILDNIDEMCDFRFPGTVSGKFRLDQQNKSFTDTKGDEWHINPWQIDITDGNKPFSSVDGSKNVRYWSETHDSQRNLIAISAAGVRLGKLLFSELMVEKKSLRVPTDVTYCNDDINKTSKNYDDNVGNQNIIEPCNNYNSVECLVDIFNTEDNSNSTQEHKNIVSSKNIIISEADSNPDILKNKNDIRNIQKKNWESRKVKSNGHIRVAIFQWNLHDTYFHPLHDIEFFKKSNERNENVHNWEMKFNKKSSPTKETPENWTESLPLLSYVEYRRRKLLEEVLFACENFGVDILILPEYSVRPDTVLWLKQKLLKGKHNVSVIAGTYRLYGDIDNDPIFDKEFKSIINNISKELSSVLTLLIPIEIGKSQREVLSLTRGKKYPALAASEVFNPSQKEWTPLVTLDSLFNSFKDNDLKLNVVGDFTNIIEKTRHIHFIAEFICAELFLPMSPINYNVLASEFKKLSERFGIPIDDPSKVIQTDVANISNFLGKNGPPSELERRSLLVVPAMTSRTADYWIFGQAALLAGGTTTIFCNAVCGKASVGGSCFIGRKSWNGMENSYKNITPYNGWSKGIFYNNKKHALGEKEQAMVIADIDPVSMNVGKPRPQAMPEPLQLVAYLPVIETLETIDNNNNSIMEYINFLKKVEYMKGQLINPEKLKKDLSKDYRTLGELCTESKESIKERLIFWEKNWRQSPIFGTPPALIDFLWVNCKIPNNETDAKIIVPPWR